MDEIGPEPRHRDKSLQEGQMVGLWVILMVLAEPVGKTHESLGLVMGTCGDAVSDYFVVMRVAHLGA